MKRSDPCFGNYTLLSYSTRSNRSISTNNWLTFLFVFFETKGRHANIKAQEVIDHLASFCEVERRFGTLIYDIRVTSHVGLRAHDHDTSSTHIDGKGKAGPSSLLHTTLEGSTEYVKAS